MSVRSVLLLITLFLFGASAASAQPWQITTPRQVLPVPLGGSTLTFSIDTLDFGTGNGNILPDQIINLNPNSSVTVVDIRPETPGSPFSIMTKPPTSWVISAGDSLAISVMFAPSIHGIYFEKFDVTTTDGLVFHFYAKGVTGVPKVSLEKSVLDFGKVILKQSRTLTDQFGNIGSANLNIISTQNTNPLEYTIVGNERPISYAPGHSIIYSIIFSPQVDIPFCANHDGAFIFKFDDGTDTTIKFNGCDHQPLEVKLEIDTSYFVSAGRQIDVVQKLVNLGDPLDSILTPVNDFSERISFDSSLFDLISVSKAAIIDTNQYQWNLTTTNLVGAVDININSSTLHFGAAGSLLTLRFQAHSNVKTGQFTSLIQQNITFNNPIEPIVTSDAGRITISDLLVPIDGIKDGTLVVSSNPSIANKFTIIHIVSDKFLEATITVFNLLGEFIQKRLLKLVPGEATEFFNTSDWVIGTYIAKVETSSGIATTKFVISH